MYINVNHNGLIFWLYSRSPPLPLRAEPRLEEIPEVLVAGGEGPRRPPPPLLVVERVDLLALTLVIQTLALYRSNMEIIL